MLPHQSPRVKCRALDGLSICVSGSVKVFAQVVLRKRVPNQPKDSVLLIVFLLC